MYKRQGDGKAEAGLIGVGGVQFFCRHVVEAGAVQAGDEQRIALILAPGLRPALLHNLCPPPPTRN
ncbi:hypothetical protein, partial [Aeromonas salmonicida]|uniref:hypothetical protein n=1 Tax=Aeromonas salmonicida TaxID=645 RepID=UPI003D314BDD